MSSSLVFQLSWIALSKNIIKRICIKLSVVVMILFPWLENIFIYAKIEIISHTWSPCWFFAAWEIGGNRYTDIEISHAAAYQ
jgi:hypothetical protein